MKKTYQKLITTCLLISSFIFLCGVDACEKLNTVKIINNNMVSISGGTFDMGCSTGDVDCYGNEYPQHEVTVSSFEIGRHEVTQGQWEAVMDSNPSHFVSCGYDCPVEMVSWDDIQIFIAELDNQTDQNYRLCSEAEWEYALRAGTETKWYCGDDESCVDDIGWYNVNSGDMTQRVSQKDPNAWGLYDMSGNVWEWVSDFYDDYTSDAVIDPTGPDNGSEYTLRGGSWFNENTTNLKSSRRASNVPDFKHSATGFRLCR